MISLVVREAWLALCLGACFSPSAPIGLPCGEGLTCPEGQTCDIVSNECGLASEALILRDDTAADFAVTGAYTAEVEVEKQGFVGPRAYFTGGLRVTGYDGLLLDDLATSFETIAANAKTGAGIHRSSRVIYQTTNPPGLGIADPDSATVTLEGEIDLDAIGTWRFLLLANDQGFFEIARPGSDTYERVVEDVNSGTIGTFVSTQTGWHKFRGAFQDSGGLLDFDLEYDPPNINGNGFREVPSDFLRVDASGFEGLNIDGFEHGNLIFHKGSIVSGASLAGVTLGLDHFGIAVGIGGFSYRWSGQFLVDDDGDYAFEIDSVHGHRLWIDGVQQVNAFDNTPQTTVTQPIALAAGWHDVVLDVNKDGGTGPGAVSFTVTTGQFEGGVIPADHLRPVPGRVARFVTDRNTTNVAMPDGTGVSASRTVNLDLPASMGPVTDVRAAVNYEGDNLATISMVIDPPAGTAVTVVDFGDQSGMGEEFFHVPFGIGNAGSPWQFIGTDNLADALVGSILAVYVTMLYDGGIAPFAQTYRYESAVRDLGDAVGFERIAWTTRQAADPAAVAVRLRTCDAADACAAEPYVEVANASEPAITPRRFFQYEVEITGTGEIPTALDAIELRYFVRGMQ